jgi:hypothetical protein
MMMYNIIVSLLNLIANLLRRYATTYCGPNTVCRGAMEVTNILPATAFPNDDAPSEPHLLLFTPRVGPKVGWKTGSVSWLGASEIIEAPSQSLSREQMRIMMRVPDSS